MLVASVVAAAFVLVAGAPAQASTSECVPDTVCVWNTGSYTGLLVTVWKPPGTCYNLPAAANDRAETFYNHLQERHVQFYKDANCAGHLLHRNTDCSQGPFGPSAVGTFNWGKYSTCGDFWLDTNVLTSIWFNSA
jgi:hypothetical protein